MPKSGRPLSESGASLLFTDAAIGEIRTILFTWEKEHYKPYPWRASTQPWHGLIAEILLQRTKVKNVIPVYQEFITRFSTLESLAQATEGDIENIISGLHDGSLHPDAWMR